MPKTYRRCFALVGCFLYLYVLSIVSYFIYIKYKNIYKKKKIPIIHIKIMLTNFYILHIILLNGLGGDF